jgi:hypothetical protein
MGPICKRWVGGTRGEDDVIAVGPTCQPIKNKNKEEKYFYGMTRANFFSHKPEYIIFMKNIF